MTLDYMTEYSSYIQTYSLIIRNIENTKNESKRKVKLRHGLCLDTLTEESDTRSQPANKALQVMCG